MINSSRASPKGRKMTDLLNEKTSRIRWRLFREFEFTQLSQGWCLGFRLEIRNFNWLSFELDRSKIPLFLSSSNLRRGYLPKLLFFT
jgi:hypothetical protein